MESEGVGPKEAEIKSNEVASSNSNDIGEMMMAMGTKEVEKQVEWLNKESKNADILIEGKCAGILLKALDKIDWDKIEDLDEKEKVDFLKRIAEIKRSVSGKVDSAIQINFNQISDEEAKRFNIDV